eukprot:gene287-521_t
MVDAFGGSRAKVKPPERGVFPLDHDGECKLNMKNYLACISKSNGDQFPCKTDAKLYLQCRMDRDLMAKEDLSGLGLGENAEYKRVPSEEGKKEKLGFVGGIGVRPGSKWAIVWLLDCVFKIIAICCAILPTNRIRDPNYVDVNKPEKTRNFYEQRISHNF